MRTEARRPFRFLLCGDPALVSELRGLLLHAAPGANVPDDAAATLETIDPARGVTVDDDTRAIVFLGRGSDLEGARATLLAQTKLPVFALTLSPAATATAGPTTAPLPGQIGEYVVSRLDRDVLRNRFFPHLLDRCKGVEIAVGRRLPALRESATTKLARDAASSALKVSAASALVDNVPLLGIVLGAVASAGDVVAITGIQVVLLMQIGAIYGKDPDLGRVWELLPVVGGGLGWRALSRQLSGFIPVAGVAVKGAIAYAGTIVVGESAGFFYEYGRHMAPADAGALYEEKRRAAMTFARTVVDKIRRKK